MKRDAAESLTTIRALCNEFIDKSDWKRLWDELQEKCKTDSGIPRNPLGLIGQIEWICRHALEDYAIKCNEKYTNEESCPNDAIEKWERIPGKLSTVVGELYICQSHIDKRKAAILEVAVNEEDAEHQLKNIKITKL
jgi:hypothetical protein